MMGGRGRAAAAALAAGGACYALWRYRQRHDGTAIDGRIEEVLSFWFGSGEKDIDVLQRSLWFARGTVRDAADKAAVSKFGGLTALALEGALDGWTSTARGAAALIVLLDQVSRHVYRGRDPAVTEAASVKAAGIFEACFGHAGRWDATKCLSPSQHVFAWMCLRHTSAAGSPAALRGLLELVEARAASDAREAAALERFRRASAKRLREATAPKIMRPVPPLAWATARIAPAVTTDSPISSCR